MGIDPASIAMIASSAAQVATPLIAGRGADPTGAVTSQPPQPQMRGGGAQAPQAMATQANVGGQDQAMQILMMLMKVLQNNPGLIGTQNPMSPMQQAFNQLPQTPAPAQSVSNQAYGSPFQLGVR